MTDLVERLLSCLSGRRKPNWKTLGASYESAIAISKLKNADMALYLRERRCDSGSLRSFHRKRSLAALRARGL